MAKLGLHRTFAPEQFIMTKVEEKWSRVLELQLLLLSIACAVCILSTIVSISMNSSM